MRSILKITPFALVASIMVLSNCSKKDEAVNTVNDVDQTASLKNVTVTYDSLSYLVGLPPGTLESGKSFDELRKTDSATYTNPANYSITLMGNMKADNTKDGAKDAKFDGMDMKVIMDTITSGPINTSASGFTVEKNTTKPVVAQGTINLLTHRAAGLYMFKQIADGNNMLTTLAPFLNYKIGSTAGSLDLPDLTKDVPTRADQKTKDFLKGMIDSQIFAKK